MLTKAGPVCRQFGVSKAEFHPLQKKFDKHELGFARCDERVMRTQAAGHRPDPRQTHPCGGEGRLSMSLALVAQLSFR